jgi:hypothetical protein
VLNPERIAGCYLLSTFRILADEIFAILSRQQPFFSGQSEGVNPKSLSKTQKYYFLFKLHFNFPFVFFTARSESAADVNLQRHSTTLLQPYSLLELCGPARRSLRQW